jgi:hypothetical protein
MENAKRFMDELSELCKRYGALYGMPSGCVPKNGTIEFAIWLRSEEIFCPTLEELGTTELSPSCITISPNLSVE